MNIIIEARKSVKLHTPLFRALRKSAKGKKREPFLAIMAKTNLNQKAGTTLMDGSGLHHRGAR